MTKSRITIVSFLALIAFYIVLVAGCVSAGKGVGGKQAANSAGNGTSGAIASWVWIGIGGAALSVVLMIIMKNDTIPLAILGGSGTALGVALTIQTILPWLKWIFMAGLALGLVWLYARYHTKLFPRKAVRR